MKVKLLYIGLILCVCGNAYAKERQLPKISVVEYNRHTFLYFNEYQIIHDPDCRCSLKWEGHVENKDKTLSHITLYRSYVSDYD